MINENFIIFGEDFNRHPHALEHILRPLFDTNKFLWVETIGLRSPRFTRYDCLRIIEKIKSWIGLKNYKKPNKTPPNIFILKPFMIPFNQHDWIRYFNKWNVKRVVNKELLKYKMKDTILISSVPNACDYVGIFNEKIKIYYCVDEFSLWPGLSNNLVKKLEEKLLNKVDLIITTSEKLSLTKQIPGRKTFIITHGVDDNHFKLLTSNKHNTKTQICYFGLFDERTNQEILLEILKKVSNCELHILGKVICDTSDLNNFSNIYFHGNILYSDLPATIKNMDIFILPYHCNELTENINPLKLKEYLATGRPVISTQLPEILKLKEFLYIAKNSCDFVDIIKKIQSEELIFNSDLVRNYIITNETWSTKSYQLEQIITNTMTEMIK